MATANQTGELENKLPQKKQIKKETKINCLISKINSNTSFSIEHSQLPTSNIFIINGGIANGIERRVLSEVLSREIEPEQCILYMPRDFSYSFAHFPNPECAIKVMSKLNGQSIPSLTQIHTDAPSFTLSLVYIMEMPLPKPSVLPPHPPKGTVLIPNFISKEEEEFLIQLFLTDMKILDEASANPKLKNRTVKHFGYQFDYSTNSIVTDPSLVPSIPTACSPIIDRMLAHLSVKPDQLTVNYYSPGQGIPPHIETHGSFNDQVCSISLLSNCLMEFKKQAPVNESENARLSIYLQRYSLFIMSDELRYAWSHGIASRKYDIVDTEGFALKEPFILPTFFDDSTLIPRESRLSLTFRKVKVEHFSICECEYNASVCDGSNKVGCES